MVAYNFVKQFAARIEDGSKKHTIRPTGKRRHARKGDKLQLYYGQRTKHCRKLRDDTCVESADIQIMVSTAGFFSWIRINEKYLCDQQMELFATEDGFESLSQMSHFFFEMYGPGLFEGKLIIWNMDSVAGNVLQS